MSDSTKQEDRLGLIMASSAVIRYHTQRCIRPETVGEHSYIVAHLCWILAEINGFEVSSSLLKASLIHDMPEAVTGDIPSPVKRIIAGETSVASILSRLESDVLKKVGIEDISLTPIEERILRIADIFSGCMYCFYEVEGFGNKHMSKVLETYISYAEKENLTIEERSLFNLITRRDKE